jgi:hypothetical protein
VAALPPEAFHLRHGHSGDANIGQGRAHVIKLKRFNYCGDEFHGQLSVGTSKSGAGSQAAAFCSFHATPDQFAK